MAECEKIMQLCEESLDRMLSDEEQTILERHLQACPCCAAYLADLQFLHSALAETPEPPAALHESIMKGILDNVHSTVVQPRQPSCRPPVIGMLIAAAACVALVLSGALGELSNTFDFGMSGGGMSGSGSASASDMASAGAASADTEAEGGFNGSAMPADLDGGSAVEEAAPAEPNPTGVPQTDPNADFSQYQAAQSKLTEPRPTEPTMSDAEPAERGENGNAPQGRSAPAPVDGVPVGPAVQPQVGAFVNSVMEGEVFAACYLVEGGDSLPNIGQEQQRDESFGYYVVDNNLAQLETLLDQLEKAGCSVSSYEESGVLFNESAPRVILVVRLG